MIKEKYILAAGSPAFSKGLAEIFRGEGWQVDTVANKEASVRHSQDNHDLPQYLVTDKLKEWVIRLARELQPQGTVIILSGFMPEAPEELERILGVPYMSMMGLPSKVASVLLGKDI